MALAIGLEECIYVSAAAAVAASRVFCCRVRELYSHNMNGVRRFLDTHSLINRGYLGNQTIIHAHGNRDPKVRSVFLNCIYGTRSDGESPLMERGVRAGDKFGAVQWDECWTLEFSLGGVILRVFAHGWSDFVLYSRPFSAYRDGWWNFLKTKARKLLIMALCLPNLNHTTRWDFLKRWPHTKGHCIFKCENSTNI